MIASNRWSCRRDNNVENVSVNRDGSQNVRYFSSQQESKKYSNVMSCTTSFITELIALLWSYKYRIRLINFEQWIIIRCILVIMAKRFFLQFFIYLFSSKGLDGRSCVLRSICESAHASFDYTNGILGELMHVIMTYVFIVCLHFEIATKYFRFVWYKNYITFYI